MKFYIVDTTVRPVQEKFFDTYQNTVQYLEQMLARKENTSRKNKMLMLEEIGHGYDDNGGVNFVRHMSDSFNIGVTRDEGGVTRKMRCDITSVDKFQSTEFGD